MIESRPFPPRHGRRVPAMADGALRTRCEQVNRGGRGSRPRDGNGRERLREVRRPGPVVSRDDAHGKPMESAFRGRTDGDRFIFRAAPEAGKSCIFGK